MANSIQTRRINRAVSTDPSKRYTMKRFFGSSKDKIDMERIYCLLCTRPVQDPRYLPCDHGFCLDCLLGYADKMQIFKIDNSRFLNISCPTCQSIPDVSSASDLSDKLLADLPKEHRHSTILRSVHLSKSNDSAIMKCKTCKKKVAHLCRTCHVVLCEKCKVGHEMHSLEKLECEIDNSKSELLSKVDTLQAHVSEKRKMGLQLEELLTVQKRETLRNKQSISRQVNHIVEKLRKEEQRMVEELNRHERDLESIYKRYKTYMDYIITSTARLESFMTRMSQEGQELLLLLHSEEANLMAETVQKTKHKDAAAVKRMRNGLQYKPKQPGAGVLQINELDLPKPKKTEPPSFVSETRDMLHQPKLIWEIKVPSQDNFSPHAVLYLPNDKLLVSHYHHKCVRVYDTSGKGLLDIHHPEQMSPRGMTLINESTFAVTDDRHKRIAVFDLSGKSLGLISNDKLWSPCGISVLPNGNFAVSDVLKHEVYIITAEGQLLHQFGGEGNGNHEFNKPNFVALDSHKRLFVSDNGNNVVKIFDTNGNFLNKFSSGFVNPEAVSFDSTGNIIVVDSKNNRVCMLSPHAQFISELLNFNKQQIMWPKGFALSNSVEVAITESTPAIKVFELFR